MRSSIRWHHHHALHLDEGSVAIVFGGEANKAKSSRRTVDRVDHDLQKKERRRKNKTHSVSTLSNSKTSETLQFRFETREVRARRLLPISVLTTPCTSCLPTSSFYHLSSHPSLALSMIMYLSSLSRPFPPFSSFSLVSKLTFELLVLAKGLGATLGGGP